ncbi:MAG TPA: hypothetical protein VNL70_00320, partial [Tepidisphaeraceae bacterium]|nr:hypothetical protein [Tepidisphaeraceae bacterium]
MDRNMRRSPPNVLALAAAAAATVVLAGRSLAGQISTMEGDINSVHQPPGTGEPSAFTWGDSFDANQVEHLPSTIGVTDGLGSMNVHDPDGGFSWGTQYMLNDPANQPRYIDLTTSTKLLMDISTPGGNPNLPTYSVGFGAINYAFGSPQFPNGLFLDSYNISGGGNFYQFASGPASQTELTTQTYVWDFGREMTANGVPLWAGLNGYVILHFNSNSPAGVPADYYYDHLRVVNVDYTTRPTWQGAGSGSWTDAARWANGVPNAVGAAVIFYGAGDGSVTLNSGVTVGSIVFDSLRTTYDGNDGINTGIPGIGADPNITAPDDPDMAPIVNYTISGTGSLTFDVNSGLAEIYGIVGNHNINVPVTVNDSLDIDMAAGFGPDNNPGLPGGGRFTN